MSNEQQEGTDISPRTGLWQRFVASLRALDGAVDTSYDSFQDQRISALAKEVASLRSIVSKAPPAATKNES